MPKTPEAVTAAEWKKAKPLTLKDPGLDKKLAEWEKAKAELATTPSMANFKKCGSTLAAVVAMSKTAQAACNKTLHKDAIAFLAGYPAAVAKVSHPLQKQGEDYSVKVAAWSKKRVVCLDGMKKHKAAAKDLLAKFAATKKTCEASIGDPKFGQSAVGLAEHMLEDIKKFRTQTQATMDVVRIDDPHTRINVDDRDQKFIDMFTAAIDIQKRLEGDLAGPISYLEKYIKAHKK